METLMQSEFYMRDDLILALNQFIAESDMVQALMAKDLLETIDKHTQRYVISVVREVKN